MAVKELATEGKGDSGDEHELKGLKEFEVGIFKLKSNTLESLFKVSYTLFLFSETF